MRDKGLGFERGLSRLGAAAALALAILVIAQASASAYWYIYSRKWVFCPTETATVGISAEGERSISMEVYRIDRKWFDEPAFAQKLQVDAPRKLVKRWTVTPPARARKNYATWDVAIPTTGKGLYLVTAKTDKRQQSVTIAVTDLALVAKQSGTHLAAWVTDITSGKPLPDKTVRVQPASPWEEDGEAEPGNPVEGLTDSDGLAEFELQSEVTNLVSVRSGDSVAYCYTYAERGSEKERVYLYTERPVYRPKQTVYFKGVARRDLGHEWETLANQEVGLTISDPEGDDLLSEKFTTNEFGSFAGSLDLSAAPLLGWYSMQAAIGDSISYSSFTVEEYRKPEFRVTAGTPQEIYFPGDKIEFTVDASYYFGAPVADAQVTYYVYSGYHSWYTYEDDLEAEFAQSGSDESGGDEDEYYGYGELLYEGDAVTGPDGKATIVVEAKPEESARRYTIEARVTDKSRREQRGSGACVVAPAQLRPEVSVNTWIAKPGERVTASIEAVDVMSGEGAPTTVELALRKTWWTQTGTGSRKHWIQKFQDVWKKTIQADASGKVTYEIEVPDKDGEYEVVAAVRDGRGRTATDTTWFSVVPSGRSSWVERATLKIQADKSRYQPGESARIIVTGSKPDSYVLVTVEGFKLFECFVKRLEGYSAYLEIPIREEFRPNVYFKVCSVSGMSFNQDTDGVRVSPEGKYLSVEVSPDREQYGPGDTATYTLSTLSQDGDPVSAEVSLGVVDEAIYAIRPDQTPDIRRFFYSNKRNSVRTSHSFAQQYAGGGGKGEPEEAGEAEIEIRKRFEDTAYWNPFIVTDGSGRASVSFELPDNLTTWRATAIATTRETAVGRGGQKQIVTKPLVARLITPRFLVQDDAVTISGIVHNYTEGPQEVGVSLEAEGARIVSGSEKETIRLEPEGQSRIDWTVAAGDPGEATFTLKAVGTSADDAMALTLPVNPFGVRQVEAYSARAESEISRVFLLPDDARPGSGSLTVSLAPSLAATVLQSMRGLAHYPYGCIEQTMSGFLPDVLLARAMRDLGLSDDWLDANLQEMVEVGFQKIYSKQSDSGGWGWAVQDEVDAYWTNYVVYGLLMARDAGFEVKEDRLDRGLAALRQAEYDASEDPKAEVVYTLSLVEGRKWHEHAVRALSRLRSEIGSAHPKRGANEIDCSLAYLALAFAGMGDSVRTAECCGLLTNRATKTADTAFWGSAKARDWYYGTQNTETTAWALRALLAVDPENSLLPKAVKWLMQQRTDKGWHSTKDSCAVLIAMIEYLQTTRELEANYAATVTVNGRVIGERHFTHDDIFKPEVQFEADAGVLEPGANVVTVTKDGEGTLYWTGVLSYYMPADKARASQDGLEIEKLYLKAEAVRKKQRWGWDWDWEYSSAKDGVEPGDLIYCKLVIRSKEPEAYVLIADPIPAGCEFEKDDYDYGYWWGEWWYGQREYHDDHIAFLSSSLDRGKNVITYYLRAETPGEFHVSPAEISEMYAPEVRANSQAMGLTIREQH